MIKVIKRDGSTQDFNKQRIIDAIKKAGGNDVISSLVADKIEEKINNNLVKSTVSDIEQAVVSLLIDMNNKAVAISYEGSRAIQE